MAFRSAGTFHADFFNLFGQGLRCSRDLLELRRGLVGAIVVAADCDVPMPTSGILIMWATPSEVVARFCHVHCRLPHSLSSQLWLMRHWYCF